jgi:hypothetical protein
MAGMRKWIALGISVAVVIAVRLLAHLGAMTPIPFWMMLPGILIGALCPDSGFNWEGDTHRWGAISSTVVYVVNVALYWGLAYGTLAFLRIPRTSVISRDPWPNTAD